jgi:hypothetical protein
MVRVSQWLCSNRHVRKRGVWCPDTTHSAQINVTKNGPAWGHCLHRKSIGNWCPKTFPHPSDQLPVRAYIEELVDWMQLHVVKWSCAVYWHGHKLCALYSHSCVVERPQGRWARWPSQLHESNRVPNIPNMLLLPSSLYRAAFQNFGHIYFVRIYLTRVHQVRRENDTKFCWIYEWKTLISNKSPTMEDWR